MPRSTRSTTRSTPSQDHLEEDAALTKTPTKLVEPKSKQKKLETEDTTSSSSKKSSKKALEKLSSRSSSEELLSRSSSEESLPSSPLSPLPLRLVKTPIKPSSSKFLKNPKERAKLPITTGLNKTVATSSSNEPEDSENPFEAIDISNFGPEGIKRKKLTMPKGPNKKRLKKIL